MREDNRCGYKRYILTKQEVIESFNNPYKVVWQASGHGMNTIGNSMNISRRSAKYESTDLLRILNSSDNDLPADRLSLFDNTIMIGDMMPVREETSILS